MPNNCFRFIEITNGESGYRTDYRKDYARILHCPSFRRLQSKTQLFPGDEIDHFRNRLTHSLEVAQIAKTLAYKLIEDYPELKDHIEPAVCETAGLLHDLGHPPFGHNGEKALDKYMRQYGGFEGNAQTIRIITKLEKKETYEDTEGAIVLIDDEGKDIRVGLNLTARTIASAIKYDNCIDLIRPKDDKVQKGYYQSECEIIRKIKEELTHNENYKDFKTIECSIMDLADDIAYSTYDLEDALKADFLTPFDIMGANDKLLDKIIKKLKDDEIKEGEDPIDKCRGVLYTLFEPIWKEFMKSQEGSDPLKKEYVNKTLGDLMGMYDMSNKLASSGYYRINFTSHLVKQAISGVKVEINEDYPHLSKAYFEDETRLQVNILKHFAYVALIESPRLKVSENRGQDIITAIFKKIDDGKEGLKLLPEDFQEIYCRLQHEEDKKRLICDFIAGMTDRYALEFYNRLYSENPKSIFKPIG